jgi:hypothetical protein
MPEKAVVNDASLADVTVIIRELPSANRTARFLQRGRNGSFESVCETDARRSDRKPQLGVDRTKHLSEPNDPAEEQ